MPPPLSANFRKLDITKTELGDSPLYLLSRDTLIFFGMLLIPTLIECILVSQSHWWLNSICIQLKHQQQDKFVRQSTFPNKSDLKVGSCYNVDVLISILAGFLLISFSIIFPI